MLLFLVTQQALIYSSKFELCYPFADLAEQQEVRSIQSLTRLRSAVKARSALAFWQ